MYVLKWENWLSPTASAVFQVTFDADVALGKKIFVLLKLNK